MASQELRPPLPEAGAALPRLVGKAADHLQLRSSQPGSLLKRIRKMQSAQFLRRNFVGTTFVYFEQPRLLRGEIAIQHIEICFVVQANRAIIEITRADRD